jgi:acetyl esterase|tara:strand:- start:70 stop:978 length:909 start_codon:yes stop_codon:yes gene_type:complete
MKLNRITLFNHRHTSKKASALLILLSLLTLTSFAANPDRPLEPIAAKLEPTKKIVYKRVAERELALHVFNPEGHRSNHRRIAYLTIHGGGWVGGEPRKFYPFADYFARKGMVGISIEYRLLNKKRGTTVFDCVKDGRSAIRYIRTHAEELGIDPNRIIVSGGSAGAHVAVGTALFDGVDEAGENTSISSRPNGVVLYYPVIDTSSNGYGQAKIGEQWHQLSPVDNIVSGLPPMLLFHGTGDTVTPYPGVKRFQERMTQAGNDCELITHPDGPHGHLIFDLNLWEDAMKRTEAFIQSIFSASP